MSTTGETTASSTLRSLGGTELELESREIDSTCGSAGIIGISEGISEEISGETEIVGVTVMSESGSFSADEDFLDGFLEDLEEEEEDRWELSLGDLEEDLEEEEDFDDLEDEDEDFDDEDDLEDDDDLEEDLDDLEEEDLEEECWGSGSEPRPEKASRAAIGELPIISDFGLGRELLPFDLLLDGFWVSGCDESILSFAYSRSTYFLIL